MLVGVRLILSMWSFMHEVLFGKKTVIEALRSNPGKMFLMACFFASFIINVRVLPKVLNLTERNAYLELSYKELQERTKDGNPSFEDVARLKAEIQRLKGEAVTKPPPTPAKPASPPVDDSEWLLSQFESINKRESTDVHRQK